MTLNARTIGRSRAALAVLGLVLAACSGSAPREEQMRAAVVAMLEDGWSRGEVGVFEDTLADPVTFHYNGAERRMARGELDSLVRRWREAFPDLEMQIDALIVEEELAAVRATLSGTHQGTWRGAEPTGKRVRMALMLFFRFEGSRVVELWETDDQLGFRRQLGLLSP